MKTLIITDVRIYKVDNKYYAGSSLYRIIERYSNAFKNVSLVTRIIESKEVPDNYKDATSFCYEFMNLGSLKNILFPKKDSDIVKNIKSSDFIIFRVSLIPIFIYKYIKKYHKKYLAEVMGCAWDALWNRNLIGKIIAPYAFFKTKRIIYNADYSLYVTKTFLQKRYPCKNECIDVSNVDIKSTREHKKYSNVKNKKYITMMTAAAVNVKYKGQKYVIKALNKLNKKNIHIKYYLAGSGDNKYLMKYVNKYHLQDQVIFLGALSQEELHDKMKEIDFYIQPSLQEGLPRSVIEAMSQGCICLGTTTAGIPELLKKEQLFKRKSVSSIVKTIEKNIQFDLNKLSKQNILESKKYLSTNLDRKRYKFYDKIIKDMSK